jgi:hypothetical protein
MIWQCKASWMRNYRMPWYGDEAITELSLTKWWVNVVHFLLIIASINWWINLWFSHCHNHRIKYLMIDLDFVRFHEVNKTLREGLYLKIK